MIRLRERISIVMVNEIHIIGAGMGTESCLSHEALELIAKADIVLATARLYDRLSHLSEHFVKAELAEIFNKLSTSDASTAVVLASGDVGFYSIARSLKAKLHDTCSIYFTSGINSLQYLTARLCLQYDDIVSASLHGRNVNPIPYVCYNSRVFFLTGGQQTVDTVISRLVNAGLSDVIVTVGENLSDISERITTGKAEELEGAIFSQLSVMLVENPNFVNPTKKIYDDEFIRGSTPMTKEAVRTLSLSYLEISPSDTVLDIGAGTGSCSIEIARRAYQGSVYAIERDEQSAALINQNIKKFGAYNITTICDSAPQALSGLDHIDCAFIGGSGGKLFEIVAALTLINPTIRIVINAITLETLHEAVSALEKCGAVPMISCINVSMAERVGRYNMMKSQNPIYIIVARWNKP